MKKNVLCILLFFFSHGLFAEQTFESDIIPTSKNDLKMTFIAHGTLMFEWDGKVIHIDPVSRYADYDQMPDADLILITHHHGDHLDAECIEKLTKDNTQIILTQLCQNKLGKGTVLSNGDNIKILGIYISAVPAYNLISKRPNGEFWHPKGDGNGYVLSIADKKIYVAGDTEVIPEMKALKHIDVAFLPMNLPYTMSPEMVAEAVNMFHPDILYPYHYGKTDTNEIIQLLKNNKKTEIRIRSLQ